MEKKSRVVLVEDQLIVREGIKSLLSKLDNLSIVGEASNGLEAISIIKECQPDLVIIDIMMPKKNGIEVIREVKKDLPSLKCLVLSAYQEDEYIYASIEAGADGYLLKDIAFDEFKIAIRSIINGKSYIGSDITQIVFNGLMNRNKKNANGATYTTRWDVLTSREKEITNLIANGHNNKEIADVLCIIDKTVGTHRANIMKKLNIHSSSALTAFVIERRNAIRTIG